MPYPFTAEDVGDVPGKKPLSLSKKQSIAEEWNKNHEAVAAESIIAARRAEYGSPEKQIENIIEMGLQFEQDRVAAIKAKHPKP